MNKDLIPKGHYCYHYDSTIENNTSGYICNCPYNNYKTINGVDVDWCDYINQGDLGNSMSEEDFEKLVEHFGSEDEVVKNVEKIMVMMKQQMKKLLNGFIKLKYINYK